MPRCLRAGEDGQVAHTGRTQICPWGGDRLPPPPPQPGTCATCSAPAMSPRETVCEPCHFRRIAVRCANGHTTEQIAALRTAGRSWREIAVACGLTRPRKGPRSVQNAAFWAWDAAGHPGIDYDAWPSCPPDVEYNAWLRSPELAPYQRAREAAIDRWLRDVALSQQAEVADAR